MISFTRVAATVVAGCVMLAGQASAASYYLFDGDARRAVEISNGAVVRGFDTFGLGYPVAVKSTIWLGGRDNAGGAEYNLDGTPTGNVSAGGAIISQLLDGTTDGTRNYGVTCCRGPNVVTIANADWSNQEILFAIDTNGSGIAFDTATNSLFLSDFSNLVLNYSLSGEVLGSFAASGVLVGLAYDQASDSLFGWNSSSGSLDQYSKTGTLLQSQVINVAVFGITNAYGGEIAIAAVTGAVPEPASWALLIAGFGLTGAAMRRRRGAVAVNA